MQDPATQLMIDGLGALNAEGLHSFAKEMRLYIALVEKQLDNGGDRDTQTLRSYHIGTSRAILKCAEDLMLNKIQAEHKDFLINNATNKPQ